MKAITEELCGHSFSASAISAINKRLDESLDAFASRPLAEPFPYLILDARYEKVREGGVVMSQAVLIAIGIDCGRISGADPRICRGLPWSRQSSPERGSGWGAERIRAADRRRRPRLLGDGTTWGQRDFVLREAALPDPDLERRCFLSPARRQHVERLTGLDENRRLT